MWRSHTDLVNNFKAYAFNERNFQNEFNLMCMALARLQDPEQILYMQRAFPKLTNQITELERLNKEQDRVIRRYERKYQIPEADRAPSFSAGILETLETLNLTGVGSNE
jgi:hypothetical protein